MDIRVIKNFLDDRLTTKRAVEGAAEAIGVSIATMYRYKANPEAISIGQIIKLSGHLGLPLANGAAWSKVNILESERRRLELESKIAQKNPGRRLIIVPAYTVNSELPDVTRCLLRADYGTRHSKIENEIMHIRAERTRLYDEVGYESWEIWNGSGYLDFFHGQNRFKSIPEEVRKAQIRRFIESSENPNRHRFVYLRHSPDLPMFGCHTPPGVVLVRIDDIHLEFQEPSLVESFEDTFNDYRELCSTTTQKQFMSFIENPTIFSGGPP